ncbi:hypothetical protein D3C76_1180920 [compost metagenome]
MLWFSAHTTQTCCSSNKSCEGCSFTMKCSGAIIRSTSPRMSISMAVWPGLMSSKVMFGASWLISRIASANSTLIR